MTCFPFFCKISRFLMIFFIGICFSALITILLKITEVLDDEIEFFQNLYGKKNGMILGVGICFISILFLYLIVSSIYYIISARKDKNYNELKVLDSYFLKHPSIRRAIVSNQHQELETLHIMLNKDPDNRVIIREIDRVKKNIKLLGHD